MKRRLFPDFKKISLGLLLALAPLQLCFSIPTLRLHSKQIISVEKLHKHLWVFANVGKEKSFADIRGLEEHFLSYEEAKTEFDPARTHWAVLKLHNDGDDPINWVLVERNESRLELMISSGDQVLYRGKSGQLVKQSEEQLLEGRSWEARIHIQLEPGQSKQIYFKSYHDFQMTAPFDFKLIAFDHYGAQINRRNLTQSLLQGALGILLLYHFLLFLVNHQKAYANFSLYILLQSLYFLYFHGLSKEWFFAESPLIDLGLAALPILIPSALIWANFYWIDEQAKRSTQWQGLKTFSLISIFLFVLSLLLIYSQVYAKWGFRIASVFVLLNSFFFYFFFKPYYKRGGLDVRIFLAGTLILCVLASFASVLFYFEETMAGILTQGAILLQIIFFAIALGYRQMQIADEKEKAKQRLLQELKLKHDFEEELKAHFEAKVLKRTAALEDQKNVLFFAKRQAEKANWQKSNLLSMVQHDIRTPLHAILGLSNLLQESKDEKEQSQMLNSMHIASTNLVGLVNNILDYSQIEAAEISLEQAPFVLQQMVDQLMDLILPLSKQKDLGVVLEYDKNLPYELYGCGPRLKQILANLLHNAAKFTEEGSLTFKIQLKTQTQYQALINFSIEDSGPGIPLGEQKNLFSGPKGDNFHQTKAHAGGGLGLAIVAKLLELLGSQIQLQSVEGQGANFSFDLWLGLSALEKQNRNTSLINKRILLVEDNEINQKVAIRFLQQWGVQVELAKNGAEALEKVDIQAFDLILMDLQMPIMDGYEAASMLGKHERAEVRAIPIIALSASVNQQSRKKAQAAGIQGFIAKPFNPKDLKQQIEATLIG
ncbi:MAG: response regulator [Bacteroidia bacterium]